MKLLAENARIMLKDVDLSQVCVNIPKVQATKAKIEKYHYIKLKWFCTAKGAIKKANRQPTE